MLHYHSGTLLLFFFFFFFFFLYEELTLNSRFGLAFLEQGWNIHFLFMGVDVFLLFCNSLVSFSTKVDVFGTVLEHVLEHFID